MKRVAPAAGPVPKATEARGPRQAVKLCRLVRLVLDVDVGVAAADLRAFTKFEVRSLREGLNSSSRLASAPREVLARERDQFGLDGAGGKRTHGGVLSQWL